MPRPNPRTDPSQRDRDIETDLGFLTDKVACRPHAACRCEATGEVAKTALGSHFLIFCTSIIPAPNDVGYGASLEARPESAGP